MEHVSEVTILARHVAKNKKLTRMLLEWPQRSRLLESIICIGAVPAGLVAGAISGYMNHGSFSITGNLLSSLMAFVIAGGGLIILYAMFIMPVCRIRDNENRRAIANGRDEDCRRLLSEARIAPQEFMDITEKAEFVEALKEERRCRLVMDRSLMLHPQV